MELHDLDDLFYGLGYEPTNQELQKMHDIFIADFVDSGLTINGLRVKVILNYSNVDGFDRYPETFVHLITRKGNNGKRTFDKYRANKIHWVKCILEHRNEEEITFFQYPEDDGTLRDYFWFKEGDFLVIMEKVQPDYIVITSFHIDDRRNREYFEKRERWYRNQQA